MHIIELDATNWKTVLDYWNSLRAALGAPEGYAGGIGGMLELMVWDYADPDMMVWHDQNNALRAPYTVRIVNTRLLSQDIIHQIQLLNRYLTEAREEFCKREGHDIDVNLEVIP